MSAQINLYHPRFLKQRDLLTLGNLAIAVVVLYALLGVRNPSGALLIASLLCPALTFVGIMNYLGGETLSVFFVIVGTYGFATTAMLVPAIAAFDVATGRTTE